MRALAQRSNRHRAASAGYTLLELLIVLVIVALGTSAVVLAIPAGQRDEAAVRSAASRLASDLASLRSRAIAEKRSAVLVVAERIEDGGREVIVVSRQGDQSSRGARVTFAADGGSPGIQIILSRGDARREVHVSWPFGRISVVGDRSL